MVEVKWRGNWSNNAESRPQMRNTNGRWTEDGQTTVLKTKAENQRFGKKIQRFKISICMKTQCRRHIGRIHSWDAIIRGWDGENERWRVVTGGGYGGREDNLGEGLWRVMKDTRKRKGFKNFKGLITLRGATRTLRAQRNRKAPFQLYLSLFWSIN